MNLCGYGPWCLQHKSFECGHERYESRGDTVYRILGCRAVKFGPYRYKLNPDGSPYRDEGGQMVPEEGQGL